ncbi:MAG TPA: flagellar biosynthesis protein FliQ [Woeseiaceae bacterium]|nr:flagellar biosynthesis protein FliQ [Woeseiaceae bacterium]
MSPETVTTIGQQALWVTMLIAAPMLLSALAVGLLVGMFQAATQINEMTMSFIPKLLVLVVALVVAGPWMLGLIVDYTRRLIEQIPMLIG